MKKTLLGCVLACLALCSCEQKTANTNNMASEVIGEWVILEAMGISTEAAEAQPYIHFTDSGTVNGFTSTNHFTALYTTSCDSIFFQEMGSTLRMGEDMDIEIAVLEALGMSCTLDIQDSIMNVLDSDGNNIMVLKRQ